MNYRILKASISNDSEPFYYPEVEVLVKKSKKFLWVIPYKNYEINEWRKLIHFEIQFTKIADSIDYHYLFTRLHNIVFFRNERETIEWFNKLKLRFEEEIETRNKDAEKVKTIFNLCSNTSKSFI